jgi:hypothetical protein
VKWHSGPIEAPGGIPGLSGHRVEIGVFADNGTDFSPPCFISFYFLPNERRTYDETGRILETDYAFPGSFADVTLTAQKPWRDRYRYDKDSGAPLGWTRSENGKAPVDFDADGRELLPEGPRRLTYEEDLVSRRLRFIPAE